MAVRAPMARSCNEATRLSSSVGHWVGKTLKTASGAGNSTGFAVPSCVEKSSQMKKNAHTIMTTHE